MNNDSHRVNFTNSVRLNLKDTITDIEQMVIHRHVCFVI